MAATALSSAGGVLALLEEPDQQLQVHALKQLDGMVHTFWPEIAGAIPKLEKLYEDDKFADRALAAAVTSKVYYHLEELDDALKYALGAGERFDVADESEYAQTLVAKCIDEYVALRVLKEDEGEEEPVDERLEAVVESMFGRCFGSGQLKHALGIALEARRLDVLERAIQESPNRAGMLAYCFDLSQTVVGSREFRHKVLRVLVRGYSALEVPDYISMCQCLLFLDEPATVASTLQHLLEDAKSPGSALMAYQVAFDLNENQNHPFMVKVSAALREPAAPAEGADGAAAEGAAAEAEYKEKLERLRAILSGETPADLYLHFLYGQNRTDMNVLNEIKNKLAVQNQVTHDALVAAHAIMQAGTTFDGFLRDNLQWLGKAKNWAKFSATASIGVIHKGHHKNSLKLLQPYLPRAGESGSPYSEGGALFALGLIHAGHGSERVDYLLSALQGAGSNEIVQHGACLGLGLTAMATGNAVAYEALKNLLFTDSAVAGEAASIGMGLVLLGSADTESMHELLAYAHDTKHEKIIRGIAMSLALAMYGREEEADVWIQQLADDKDHLLRYGAMYMVALAYVGTSNNGAIRKLLHFAVSDVSEDVRRAAITALGFVMCKEPDQVPGIVSLLAQSYNAHARHGVCMALGIACAGSGNQEALDLLEPMTKDSVDWVRQGAMIAMAMVLLQHNKAKEPRVEALRKTCNDTIGARGDTMAKKGAIMALGILDAGGRNVGLSLLSPAGHRKMVAIVGMAMFQQFWYWYPMTSFLSLSFSPTAVIGLNKDVKMPSGVKFTSNARPSLFAYPAPIEIKKEEKRKKVPTAQLSITQKAKARKAKKAGEGDMAVDEGDQKAADGDADAGASMDVDEGGAADGDDKDKDKASKKKKKKAEEPSSEELSNPARVTPAQQPFVTFGAGQRYQPVKRAMAGFVMLRDTRPDEEEDLVVPTPPKVVVPGISEDEPEVPAAFDL